MNKFFATVGVLTLAIAPAFAEDAADKASKPMDHSAQTVTEKSVGADKTKMETAATSGTYYTSSEKSDFLASVLIGSRVYATTSAVDSDKPVEKATDDWKDIGEINNIVIGRDGAVKAVVLGVGGFLGIGEKDVAVKMSELRFVKKTGAAADEYFIVVNSDKASLEAAPSYEKSS